MGFALLLAGITLLVGLTPLSILPSWYSGRATVWLAVPMVVGAWAVSVIVRGQRGRIADTVE